jgi:hypothetical protein
MISIHTTALHPKAVVHSRTSSPWKTGPLVCWLAGLCLILALCLLAHAPARVDLQGAAVAADAGRPEAGTAADSQATAGDSDDEEALPVLLIAMVFIGLVSCVTLPGLTVLSFQHPPLLRPPQPLCGRRPGSPS